MNCLILDDEPLALDVIKEHLNRIPFANMSLATSDVFEAMEIIQKGEIDLIFLDIQMPELTGIEFLNSLVKKPLVIFTTAYPDYALKSYEFDAVDYLMKPISFERILQGVMKAKERLVKPVVMATKVDESQEKFIFVKTEYKTVKIVLAELSFIESRKDYVFFHVGDESIGSLMSLSSVERKLINHSNFLRIHRSFIVAIDKIDSIERNTVTVNDQLLQVGPNYRETFKSALKEFKI